MLLLQTPVVNPGFILSALVMDTSQWCIIFSLMCSWHYNSKYSAAQNILHFFVIKSIVLTMLLYRKSISH